MMNRLKAIATLIGVAVVSSGCATSPYLADRGRDALDMFTAQLGYGLGAKARVGPIQTGLLADIGAFGVRGGDFLGMEDFWPSGYDSPAKQDYVGVVVGFEIFAGTHTSNRRGKSFSAQEVAFATWPSSAESLAEHRSFLEEHHIVLNPAPYYTQIDLVAAVGPSFRIGFNPGELADFLLGWLGIDIYRDDLRKQKGEEEK